MNLEDLVITDQRLGKGGFGTAFVGQLGWKKVAAKRLSQFEKEIDNLTREASKLKRLRHGKHIAYIYGITLEAGNLYMVMEYSEHGDLKNYLITNKESVTYEQKILFCRGILLGLLYCHSMKVFHGDIKCSNVLLGKNMEPKLTDFGFNMMVDNIEYYSKLYNGSLYWVAPELLSIKEDEAAYQEFKTNPYPCDVYSLGATFCEISYDGTTEFIDSDEPDMDIMLGNVSPTPKDAFLEEIVSYCCQFGRNERISLESCFSMLEKVTEEQLSDRAKKSGFIFFPTAKNEWKRIQKKIKAKTTQTLLPLFILNRPVDNLVVGLSDLSLLEWLCINDCADAVEYMVNLHNPDEKQIQWLYSISDLCGSLNVVRLFQKKIHNHKSLDLSKLMDSNPQQFIKALIRAGAKFEHDLLKKAIEKHYDQVVQTLVDLNANSENLVIHSAIRCRNIEAVKTLATGARLELRDQNDDTPLLAAINDENVEIIKILLDNNADVHNRNGLSRSNVRTEGQHTPLVRAAIKGNHEIVELLISAGATIDTEGSEWHSLVQDLKLQGKHAIIQLISNAMGKEANETEESHSTAVSTSNSEGENKGSAEATPLCTAIRNGQSGLVQELIYDGVDVNKRSYDGYSPLHWAVIIGDEKVVKTLLGAGANTEIKTPNAKWNQYSPSSSNYFNEYTSLHIAIAKRHLGIARLLIESGADFSVKNESDQTIIDMTNEEDQNEIETIIRDYAPTEPESLQKAVRLMSTETARAISMKTVKSMVSRCQADTDTISGCLVIAVQCGNTEAVSYFLRCKANINVQFNDRSLLEVAVSSGHIQVAQLLIDAGVNVNAKSVNGETPLSRCVIMSLVDMVQFLVDKGVDVNARDKDNCAPIHYAKSAEIMQILINAGADTNVKDKYGESLLHQYVKKAQTEMVQFLVDKGADTNVRDKDKCAPIHYAKSTEIMQILINAGADTNVKDKYGEPLMHQYVKKAQTEMVQFLVDKGADTNARDKDNCAPIHYVRNREIAEILVNAGTDINAKDKYGKTLFNILIEEQNKNLGNTKYQRKENCELLEYLVKLNK